jgi:hypothetical protein
MAVDQGHRNQFLNSTLIQYTTGATITSWRIQKTAAVEEAETPTNISLFGHL